MGGSLAPTDDTSDSDEPASCHLKSDFADGNLAEKTYRILEVADAAVQEVTYRRVADGPLELLGSSWQREP